MRTDPLQGRTALLLPALISAALSLALLVPAARLPLAPDEAYYWYWSRFPSAGYFDHPPMVAWIIAVTTVVGGNTELWVRAGALLCFAATQVLLYAAFRRLFPERSRAAAWWVPALFNLSLLFPGIGLVMTIDSPLVFFWALAIYAGARVVAENDGRFWWLFGAALGGAMLSKYTAVLLVPCILGFVLAAPSQRHWLRRSEPWTGAVIALSIFSPVLYWNWHNDWISFRFQLQHGFREETAPTAARLLEYLGLQMGAVSPALWLWLAVYGLAGLWVALRRRDTRLGYLFALSWPVVAFFGWTTMVGERAEANWTAPGYLGALILAVAAWHLGGFDRRHVHRVAAAAALALTLIIGLLVRVHLLHPFLPLDPEDDPLREFADWRPVAEAVEQAWRYGGNPAALTEGFLISDRGTRLAEAAFYTGLEGIDLTRPERYGFLRDWKSRVAGRDAVLILYPGAESGARYACLFEQLKDTGVEFTPRYRDAPITEYRARLFVGREFRPQAVFPCPRGS